MFDRAVRIESSLVRCECRMQLGALFIIATCREIFFIKASLRIFFDIHRHAVAFRSVAFGDGGANNGGIRMFRSNRNIVGLNDQKKGLNRPSILKHQPRRYTWP